jgi:Domain of unknown function (DUF4124)
MMMKAIARTIGFAATLSLFPALSSAQGTLYKWTDARGNIHYTNTPTSTTATSVDDTLPPASRFNSPTPPPEPEKATTPSSENPDGKEGAAPGEATGTDGSQPPTGEPADGEPAPTATDGSTTDDQQEADAKPKLTPEQEQALKDSPM